jgi:hypothetical protein
MYLVLLVQIKLWYGESELNLCRDCIKLSSILKDFFFNNNQVY